MIDLHCHILPALDDGARDLDDSIEMARQAAAHGISVVAATPHIRSNYPDVVIEELEERVEQLNTELDAQQIPVRVVTGGEVAEPMLDRLDEDSLRRVSLGGQGWILLEPRPGPLSDHLEQGVEELTRRGFRSLIAHPERHRSPDFRERLEALVARRRADPGDRRQDRRRARLARDARACRAGAGARAWPATRTRLAAGGRCG